MSIRTTLVCTTLTLLLLAGHATAAKPATPPVAPAPTTPKAPDATKPADAKTPEAPKAAATESVVYAIISTSEGDIALELDAAKAPITVANFVKYAEKGHYDGTIFHRVMKGFMIQGGGFLPDMTEKPTDPPIKNEFTNKLSHKRGTIAMARRGGRNNVDSATSQFFINVVDNDETSRNNLDAPQSDGAGYAVFGKVIAGMDVVDRIRNTPTGSAMNPKAPGNQRAAFTDVPVKPITINSVKKVSKSEAEKLVKPTAPTAPTAPAPANSPAPAPASEPASPTAPK